MIDTHAHPNLSPLLEQHEAVYSQALAAGVTDMIVVGTDIATSEEAIRLSLQHQTMFASCGIHPEVTASLRSISESEFTSQLLEWKNALTHMATERKVKAIGECGLDYCDLQQSNPSGLDRSRQMDLFSLQIQIAMEQTLPCIIHCRNTRRSTDEVTLDAYQDTLSLLKKYHSTSPYILHCVSGPVSYVKEAITLGAYVSFAGNVTYPNAQAIRDILSVVPNDRLLVETDSPFLSPQSKRGTPNTPAFVTETAQYLAGLLGLSYEEIDILTSANAQRCFSLT